MTGTELSITRRAVVLSGAAALAASTMSGASYAARNSKAQVRIRVTQWPAGAVPNEWVTARRSSRGHLSLKILASEVGVIAIEEVRDEAKSVAGSTQLEI